MKQLFLLLFLFPITSVFAQPGTLDSNFGNNGIVITSLDEYIESENMVMQTDGKVIVCGFYKVTGRRLLLIRYNTDGSIDTSFGEDGMFTSDFNVYDHVEIALLNDGKIVATGSMIGDFDMFLSRLSPNGTLDASFGNNGVEMYETGLGSWGFGLAIAPDGKILVGGSAFDGANLRNFAVLRFNPTGTLDNSFGNAGLAETAWMPTIFTFDLQLHPDGRIVVCGRGGAASYLAMAAFFPNGIPDPDFGDNGVLILDDLNPQVVQFNDFNSLEIDASGKIYGIGYLSIDMAIVKLNSDGTYDLTFGEDGVAAFPLDKISKAYCSSLDSEGRILIAGIYDFADSSSLAVARVKTDGTLDENFGDNGLTLVDVVNDHEDIARDIMVRPNGKMVVVGSSAKPFAIGNIVVIGLNSGGENSTKDLFENGFEAAVFPNPVIDYFTLEYEVATRAKLSASLMDASGKTVQTFFSDSPHQVGKYLQRLKIADHLSVGKYWLKFGSGQQTTAMPLILQSH